MKPLIINLHEEFILPEVHFSWRGRQQIPRKCLKIQKILSSLIFLGYFMTFSCLTTMFRLWNRIRWEQHDDYYYMQEMEGGGRDLLILYFCLLVLLTKCNWTSLKRTPKLVAAVEQHEGKWNFWIWVSHGGGSELWGLLARNGAWFWVNPTFRSKSRIVW
jgi:hypothetical protein